MNGELSRRIRAGWCVFNSIKDVLKGKIDKTTRKNIFNSAVLPAMLYGSEMWALMKREEQRLLVAERAMEQAMLGISLLDRIPNEIIRERNSVKDIVMKADITRCDGRATQHGSRITGGPQSLLSGTRENRKDPPVGLQEDGKMTSLNVSDERGEERQECEKNGRHVVIGAVLTTA
ncbi:hypothetical protein G0U57_017518, partial [Chelydra serpentina]